MALGNQYAFAPLDQFLFSLRMGRVEEGRSTDGGEWNPIVPSVDRHHCHSAEELLVLFAFFIKHLGAEVKRSLDVSDFFALANRLKYGFEVSDAILRPVEALAKTGQAIGATLTYEQAGRCFMESIVDKENYFK